MYWLPYSSHTSHYPSQDSLPSLNLLYHTKTDARFMQDAPKPVWSIPCVSVAFFPSLKLNFIAYCSSKVSSRPDCIFEIHQLWQSGFSGAYSKCCCSFPFEPEIVKIGPSSHKMYSNNIVNFQESTTILNASTKKVWKLIEFTTYIYISFCPFRQLFVLDKLLVTLGLSYSSIFSLVLNLFFLQYFLHVFSISPFPPLTGIVFLFS